MPENTEHAALDPERRAGGTGAGPEQDLGYKAVSASSRVLSSGAQQAQKYDGGGPTALQGREESEGVQVSWGSRAGVQMASKESGHDPEHQEGQKDLEEGSTGARLGMLRVCRGTGGGEMEKTERDRDQTIHSAA